MAFSKATASEDLFLEVVGFGAASGTYSVANKC
jgi:hypothetical protein